MLLHNYHTHTTRCHHAVGQDREYVEAAIQAGIKTLGFSDHAPYIHPIGNNAPQHRIFLEDAQDYVLSVRALAKEYEKDIRILCGYELEYYPLLHKDEMAFLRTLGCDYCILGQHFMGNQMPPIAASSLTNDKELAAYVSQVIEGLSTGDFLYIAHPDVAGFRFSDEAIEREYGRLCEFCKQAGIPLEYNLLGMRTGRHYPNDRFFKIAAHVGASVILGIDAHNPQDIIHSGAEQAIEKATALGLNLITDAIL